MSIIKYCVPGTPPGTPELPGTLVEYSLRHTPVWSSLNRMGRSRVLRSSYVWLFAVPLTAFLLAKIDREINIPIWDKTFTIAIGLPFSWKMFYFSAFAFAIASFVYSMRCPSLVRDYDKFSDFTDEGKGSRQIVEAFLSRQFGGLLREEFINPNLLDHRLGTNEPRTTIFVRLFAVEVPDKMGTYDLLSMVIPKEKLSEAFWYTREYLDRSGVIARVMCSVAYSAGFAFLLIVAVQNFIYVWRFI